MTLRERILASMREQLSPFDLDHIVVEELGLSYNDPDVWNVVEELRRDGTIVVVGNYEMLAEAVCPHCGGTGVKKTKQRTRTKGT